LWEEVGAETLVGVQQDSVDVIVGLGGNILDEELNLVDQILVGSLSRASGFVRFIVSLNSVLGISGLNLGNVEAGSEGGTISRIVEEIMESGNRKVLMLLVDLSENDGRVGLVVLDLVLFVSFVISDLAANGVSELGGADESHNVRVVLEDQDLLGGGGFIMGSRSNLDNGALFEVGELNP